MKKVYLPAVAALLLPVFAFAQNDTPAAKAPDAAKAATAVKTPKADKTAKADKKAEAKPAKGAVNPDMFYSFGFMFSHQLSVLGMTKEEYKSFEKGVADSVFGRKPSIKVKPEAYSEDIKAMVKDRLGKVAAANKAKGKTFAEGAAKEKGAVVLPDGVIIVSEKDGAGQAPVAADTVKVNYEGKLIDGTVFDSSIARGEPATFPLEGVIPCWTEALQKMKVGGKAKIVCPSDAAYGDNSQSVIPGGSTLVFNVELLEIVKMEQAGKKDVQISEDGKAQVKTDAKAAANKDAKAGN
jgi:FKBP-type peptidyl-prolyl cis-trans isomerase